MGLELVKVRMLPQAEVGKPGGGSGALFLGLRRFQKGTVEGHAPADDTFKETSGATIVQKLKRGDGRQRIAQQPAVDGDEVIISRKLGKSWCVRNVHRRPLVPACAGKRTADSLFPQAP